jgi:DNA-directed RNA polymerase specialized sigma24 family protein
MTPGIVQYLAASEESPNWFEDSWDSGRDPDLWFYRHRTQAILERFLRMSMETGKLPSILGQQFFRSHVTSYRASSFEDVVIFVHDVERSLEKLDWLSRELIGKCVLQGFSQDEVARMLGCCRKTIMRRLPDALDKLSEIFLAVGILKPIGEPVNADGEPCQEAKNEENSVIM